MIDEEATHNKYGYYSTNLSPQSHKLVICVCDKCGSIYETRKGRARNLCKSCVMSGERNPRFGKPMLPQNKKALIKSHTGENHWCFGKHLSAEHRKKISDNHADVSGANHPLYGTHLSQIHKQHISAGRVGIEYGEWSDYANPSKYCSRFDETCREHNRDRYDRKCFICGKTEEQNDIRLSVHHVDRNKDQGCDGHDWRLIPVCKVCHPTLHTVVWESRLNYLLDLEKTRRDV